MLKKNLVCVKLVRLSCFQWRCCSWFYLFFQFYQILTLWFPLNIIQVIFFSLCRGPLLNCDNECGYRKISFFIIIVQISLCSCKEIMIFLLCVWLNLYNSINNILIIIMMPEDFTWPHRFNFIYSYLNLLIPYFREIKKKLGYTIKWIQVKLWMRNYGGGDE